MSFQEIWATRKAATAASGLEFYLGLGEEAHISVGKHVLPGLLLARTDNGKLIAGRTEMAATSTRVREITGACALSHTTEITLNPGPGEDTEIYAGLLLLPSLGPNGLYAVSAGQMSSSRPQLAADFGLVSVAAEKSRLEQIEIQMPDMPYNGIGVVIVDYPAE